MIFERGSTPYDIEPDIYLLHKSKEDAFRKLIAPESITRAQRDLLLYEPRCAVCLRSADDMRSLVDPEYTTLLYCPHCRAAFACTEAHAAEYRDEHCHMLEDGEKFTECQMNTRAYEHSLEIITRGWTVKDTLWFPERRKSEYSPLPTETETLTAWEQWFADPINVCPSDSSPVFNRVRTKQLSIPMTILYGMELFDKAAGNLPLLSSRTELDIAVIGAMEYELMFGGLACWEEILHSLPSVRRLTVRFIGPRVIREIDDPNGFNRDALSRDPCALCKEKGVELVHSIHPVTFHEYVEDPETHTTKAATGDDGPIAAFQWPDLAVMFDTGMGISRKRVNPNWTPTLQVLAKNGIPTICTSFLERESEEDEELLYFTKCNIVFQRHKNPWRSEVVTKMVFSRKYFFSYNGFVQGFRGVAGRKESYSEPPIDEEKMLEISQKFMPHTGL